MLGEQPGTRSCVGWLNALLRAGPVPGAAYWMADGPRAVTASASPPVTLLCVPLSPGHPVVSLSLSDSLWVFCLHPIALNEFLPSLPLLFSHFRLSPASLCFLFCSIFSLPLTLSVSFCLCVCLPVSCVHVSISASPRPVSPEPRTTTSDSTWVSG